MTLYVPTSLLQREGGGKRGDLSQQKGEGVWYLHPNPSDSTLANASQLAFLQQQCPHEVPGHL